VSLIAEEFVSCLRGRQAEASSLGVYCKPLALKRVSLERTKPFQSIVNEGDNIGTVFISLFVDIQKCTQAHHTGAMFPQIGLSALDGRPSVTCGYLLISQVLGTVQT
jgi:hypothetical protein